MDILRYLGVYAGGASMVLGLVAVVKFHSMAGVTVLGLSITAYSLFICGVALGVLSLSMGLKGVAAFFMGAGLYDIIPAIAQTGGANWALDPPASAFQVMLALTGWYWAGRPRFKAGSAFLLVGVTYALGIWWGFFQLFEVGLFAYIYWTLRGEVRARASERVQEGVPVVPLLGPVPRS